ncbi:hypothetical protein C211_08954 [Stutzerimonas degradans]|nr:hypothetical protein C211_08954 [Stutzerimonas degradans]
MLASGRRGQWLTNYRLGIRCQWQRRRPINPIELDCGLTGRWRFGRGAATQWKRRAARCRRILLARATKQQRQPNGDQHSEHCQQVLSRNRQGKTASARALPFRLHTFDQFLSRNLVDCTRPSTSQLMNARDLLLAQALQTSARTLQALSKVFARFVLFVRLQSNDMVALTGSVAERLQPPNQRRLAKQKHVRSCLRAACSEA